MTQKSTTRRAFVAGLGAAPFALAGKAAPSVKEVRMPGGGIQPQSAVGSDGTLHLLYFNGEARQGDLFYTRSKDEGGTFSSPIRVNSREGSAVATGTIRGGQIALGRNGRVHVAWNGSGLTQAAGPVNPETGKPTSPMLYARLDDSGTRFESQRNLMTGTWELDGGGSLAADQKGGVFVAWHGRAANDAKGEAGRRAYLTRSSDDGRSFAPEKAVWNKPTGACGCCGMRMFASRSGDLHLMYRSATEEIHRDIYLLSAGSGGDLFTGELLHPWKINACPMSSMSFSEGRGRTVAAWETGGQVYFASVQTKQPVAAAAEPGKRKHPVTATNADGYTVMAWIEGSGWQKGGTLAWRMFDANGTPVTDVKTVAASPTWSFGTVFARREGGFGLIY